MPLALIKPFSGSGSTAVLTQIYKDCGPDSFAGRVASVMAGSTETTFYAVAVYFGSVGIKKTRHTIPAAVLGDLSACILSALTVRLFFNS
jgi:spore maturation protein B